MLLKYKLLSQYTINWMSNIKADYLALNNQLVDFSLWKLNSPDPSIPRCLQLFV